MKAILRGTAALYFCCASTVAFAGSLPGGKGPTNFLVGFNEAWFGQPGFGPNYVNYFSSAPAWIPPITNTTFDPKFVETMFAGIMANANGGTRIVRIWVFTALQGIVLNRSKSPQIQGLTADMINHLQTVFTLANKYQGRLKIYVTALNAGDMQDGATKYSGLRPYFQRLLTDPVEIAAFKTKALLPLLTLLNKTENRNITYAFDLINEIEAALNSRYTSFTSWTAARAWIKDMIGYVKSKATWLPVTSSGWGSAVQEIPLGLFSQLNLDFYDVHLYADSGTYYGQTALCNRVWADNVPIVLGEFGQKSHVDDFNGTIQQKATTGFINGAKNFYGQHGYCFWAALAWKFETSETWWEYLRPDGTFRPAYYLVK